MPSHGSCGQVLPPDFAMASLIMATTSMFFGAPSCCAESASEGGGPVAPGDFAKYALAAVMTFGNCRALVMAAMMLVPASRPSAPPASSTFGRSVSPTCAALFQLL